jgi:hypothetical protein
MDEKTGWLEQRHAGDAEDSKDRHRLWETSKSLDLSAAMDCRRWRVSSRRAIYRSMLTFSMSP